MIEKRGIGIDPVGPDLSIPTVKRLHQPKGIGFFLGKECGSELKGEPSRMQRKYRGEKRVKGGSIDVGGGCAVEGEQALEIRGGGDGQVISGKEKESRGEKFGRERGGKVREREAEEGRVGGVASSGAEGGGGTGGGAMGTATDWRARGRGRGGGWEGSEATRAEGGRGVGGVEKERGVGEEYLAGLDVSGGNETSAVAGDLGELHWRFEGGGRHRQRIEGFSARRRLPRIRSGRATRATRFKRRIDVYAPAIFFF